MRAAAEPRSVSPAGRRSPWGLNASVPPARIRGRLRVFRVLLSTMNMPATLAVSILAGLIGAMRGMGGGIVLVPGLTLLGMDIKHAIAISTVSVIATSSGAASAYVRDRITNLKVGMFLEMFTIIGALAGAGITVSASERPLYLLFGIVLLASWAALWAERGTPWKPVTHQDDLSR